MTSMAKPFYSDWPFWVAVLSFVALILSQLPPIRLLLKPKRLEVEAHERILIAHKVGSPEVYLYVSIRNTGGGEIRVPTIRLALSRDGKPPFPLRAQAYLETPITKQSVSFVPLSLKLGESWSHYIHFFEAFDSATDKFYRESKSALDSDIDQKSQTKIVGDNLPVKAEPALVTPFINLFDQLFVWEPGEYLVEMIVDGHPGPASYKKMYRFTLQECDTSELKEQVEDYPSGAGISHPVDGHFELSVPLTPVAGS
jgi:hypothetical protein